MPYICIFNYIKVLYAQLEINEKINSNRKNVQKIWFAISKLKC